MKIQKKVIFIEEKPPLRISIKNEYLLIWITIENKDYCIRKHLNFWKKVICNKQEQ